MIEINKSLVTAVAGTFIILIEMCSATPGSVISVEPSYQNVSKGDIFTVNITVNPDGDEIGSAQYDLCFNNTLLTALEQTKGPFLSQGGISTTVITNVITNTIGRTDYGEYRVGDPDVIGGVTTPGVLATITFKAMDEPGTSSLNLSNVIVSSPYGVPYSKITNNGRVEITETHFNITGFVNYSDGSPINNPNVTITNLNTSEVYTAETNESSNYYQVLTNFAHITNGNILHFYARDDMDNLTEFDHTVTQAEMDAGGFMQNVSIFISGTTPTPTPTPTQTSTSTSGDDGSDGGASVTPTPTSATTPSPTPTQIPGLTPTLTPTINHVSSPSSPLSPTTTTSPTPTTSMRGENNRLPGFEAAFAITGLFAISCFILKRKRGGDR